MLEFSGERKAMERRGGDSLAVSALRRDNLSYGKAWTSIR
jgi:hypothetical protein